MAKVTITIEDINDADGPGVTIRAESTPPFGKLGVSVETEAQSTCRELLSIFAQMHQPQHIHDENCHHEHDHDHGTTQTDIAPTNLEGQNSGENPL